MHSRLIIFSLLLGGVAQAANWSTSPSLVAHWGMNDDFTAANAFMVDVTGLHSLRNFGTHTNETTNFFEGSHALNSSPDSFEFGSRFACSNATTCTSNVADFDFGGGTGNFTCYMCIYPTLAAPTGGATQRLFGNADSDSPTGFVVRRADISGTPKFQLWAQGTGGNITLTSTT